MKLINAKTSTLIKIYSTIYWGSYAIKSWLNWELTNPFQWMLDVPTDESLRGMVLGTAFLALVFGGIIYHYILDDNGKLAKVDTADKDDDKKDDLSNDYDYGI
jgi:hypothetical protein